MTEREQPHTHLIERAAERLRGIGLSPLAAPFGLPPNEAGKAPPSDVASKSSNVPDATPPALIDEEALAKAGLLDGEYGYNRIAEELRILENNLLRRAFQDSKAITQGNRSNLILITSALAGEGKSFVSINVATGLARRNDRRVVLVDADGKPDGLSRLLGHPTRPGLLDLASGSALKADDLIIGTAVKNLDILTLGTDPKRSPELFASTRMIELLHDLSLSYGDRLILLDAPPCLSSSVPHALSQMVGQVMLVVAAGDTQQDDLEAALGLVQACPEILLLLNKIPPWNAHSFGLYGYPSGQA